MVAPIHGADAWRRTLVRGVIATAIGAAAVLVLGLISSLFVAVNAGLYPFGHSFQPGIDTNRAAGGITSGVLGALTAFIQWFPLVVLAAILQKLWLARHPEPAARDSLGDEASPGAPAD